MGQASRGVVTKQIIKKNILTTLGGFRQLNIVLSREEAFEHHDWYVFGNISLKIFWDSEGENFFSCFFFLFFF